MEIRKPKNTHAYLNGIIEGEIVSHYMKPYKDVVQIYKNKDENLSLDTIMYEVYSLFDQEDKALLWGLTIIHPITVAQECNMTRGHYHAQKSQPEIYFGLAGRGLLMFMRGDEIFAEEVFEGSIHYIDGEYAHRLINTGSTDFKVGACWPKLAGHDYKAIEEQPFSVRVYKKDGRIVLE
ncbi:MAG: glucose-6-phosphate isomerase family protein [Erysipelotrichaceae bacterium]|nr:glucose-6-phosphate isomerase family protein [Erysipelotrichaceae bacterium]MDP3305892.1 glucose-6-phosphate isomerase family protein [Erysipelotrichaceae bacterium]